MKNVFLSLFLLVGIAVMPVKAQQGRQSSLDEQFIIYKWRKNGIPHYAKNLPRGVEKYIMLNQYGMEVTKKRPRIQKKKTKSIRPTRPPQAKKPEAKKVDKKATENTAKETTKQGMITRKQRCEKAQKNIALLNSQKTIYEEDAGENLVPLDKATVSKRLKQAQKAASKFCREKSPR